MHDFCFTLPYGFLVVMGGIFGFLRKGSSTSLIGGVGSGGLLLVAGYQSLQAYKNGTNSTFSLILETVVSVVLTIVMGKRFYLTHKFMPAGIVATISVIMTLFYLYKIFNGGNHIDKKKAT